MDHVSYKTIIQIIYDLIGLDPTPELDVIVLLFAAIVILFVVQAILRAFLAVFFEPYIRR